MPVPTPAVPGSAGGEDRGLTERLSVADRRLLDLDRLERARFGQQCGDDAPCAPPKNVFVPLFSRRDGTIIALP